MTDSPDLHLDDELLSAVLDGEADVEQSAHADACDACRTRLGALRDASVLVATPVPAADPGRRDASIAAALAAADGDAGTVVPLRRRRTIPTWLGAAAAAVVAVGAISLVANRDGDDDTGSFDTAAEDDGGGDASTADEDASILALPAPVVVDGGDLGAIDAATLQETIEGAFGTARQGAAEETGPAADAPAAESMAAPPPCEQEIRDGNPDLGGLVYRASGTLDGAPVVVLAFDVPPDRWVYVVDVDGCGIRNQQTYSP